jgi:hypothetical protein
MIIILATLGVLLLGSCSAQSSGVEWASYSASWDFTKAASKLDALAQAQASPYFSLFNPNTQQPMMGSAIQVSH